MNKITFSTVLSILIILFICISVYGEQDRYKPADVRIIKTINRDWTFNYFPSGTENLSPKEVDFKDSAWTAIALPHTWMTYETTGDLHPYIQNASERDDPYWWNGWGWYRKRFSLSNQLKSNKIFLEFDGVQKYCKVYINGVLLGDHKGGYTSFSFDITPHVEFDAENVLCVQVSNRRDDKFGGIPPMTAGNFNVYGGIYRDVRLVVKDMLHIPYQGCYKQEGGTFITTPEVDSLHGVVNVKTFVRNDSPEPKKCVLKTIIVDSAMNVVTILQTTAQIKPNTMHEFNQTSEPIAHPKLWSPESPYLYRVYSEVWEDETITDCYLSPLGFRWFWWDYQENRLYVNGEKIHIHGTNRHQEYPWLGDAIPKWITGMDMQDIRYNLAHNFMRTAHYPHDSYVYDLTDQYGIITAEEAPNIKHIDFDEKVQEQNVREMIRRDRNHPSIFFWSMGNETSDAADSKWAWEEDTTRIIHQRKAEEYGDYVTHDHTNLDMENLLRVTVRGWYNRDVKDLQPQNSDENPKSGQHAGTEEWQHKMARVQDASIRGRIDGNIVAWLYEDHGCDREYKDAPLKHINYKGWVDNYRIPKYMYYLWQANYAREPMVFIHPHFWREQYLGQKKNIQVDSNCDEVELFVNDVSQGTMNPSRENFFTVEFTDVPIEQGTILAVARKGDEEIRRSIRMAGEPAKIILSTEQHTMTADRAGIAIVKADVVDSEGGAVPGFTKPLHWSVEGPGKLVGSPVYETDIDKKLEMEGSGYIDTPVCNVIRSTNEAGQIKVRVSSPGLEPGEIVIKTAIPKTDETALISEPRLDDGNRFAVMRDFSFVEIVEYVEEIKQIKENHIIQGDYQKGIKKFINQKNAEINPKTIEYRMLIDRMTGYLKKMNGDLIADDYNFIVRSYNDARMLNRVIDAKNFHPDYRDALKSYYATEIILKSRTVDVQKEKGLIESISRTIKIIRMKRPQNKKQSPKVKYQNTQHYYQVIADELETAISLLDPALKNLSNQQQQHILELIDRINPHVYMQGQKMVFDENEPIAIPSKEYLKHE